MIDTRSQKRRHNMYKLLAQSFLYPGQRVYDFLHSDAYGIILSEYLSASECPDALSESIHALKELHTQGDHTQTREKFEQDYNRLFAHLGSAKCPPYETEFGHDNIFQKTDSMADIAGFYRAYGLEIGSLNTERADFICTELEFMSYLTRHEAYAHDHDESEHLEICIETQRKFIADHLGKWVTVFARILAQSSENPFYSRLGRLTERFIDAEAAMLGVSVNKIAGVSAPDPDTQAPFGCGTCSAAVPDDAGCVEK